MALDAGKGRMDFIDIGWREGLLLAVAVVAVYLVVALLGLARLKRGRDFVVTADSSLAGLPPHVVPSAGRDGELEEMPRFGMPAAPAESTDAGLAGSAGSANSAAADFAHQLAARELEGEVRQLRADVAALRQELNELRSERTQRRVSPLYAEAAALAERGFDARGVAEECGISVAEAELVLAMSRDEKTFDNEDDHDGIGYAATAEPARR